MWLIWLTFFLFFLFQLINEQSEDSFLFFFCKMLENGRQEFVQTCCSLHPIEQLLVFIFVRIPGYLTQASNIFLRNKYLGLGLLHCMSANGDGLTTTTTTATTEKGFRCRLLWCLVVSKSQGLGMRRPAVAPIHSHDKRESGCRH